MLHATQCPQRETGRETSDTPLRTVPSKARGPASGRAAPTARVRPRKHPAGERGTRIEVAQLVTSHHIIRQPLAAPTRRHQQARAAVARVVPAPCRRRTAGARPGATTSRTRAHGPGPAGQAVRGVARGGGWDSAGSAARAVRRYLPGSRGEWSGAVGPRPRQWSGAVLSRRPPGPGPGTPPPATVLVLSRQSPCTTLMPDGPLPF
jgi:hypothetical protein